MLSSENTPVSIRELASTATTEMAKMTGSLIIDIEFQTLYLWTSYGTQSYIICSLVLRKIFKK